MRPTGIVMIAVYHFLSAAFLVILASALAVGGGILGATFAMGLGLFVGVLGAAFTMVFAVLAAIAGYGVWTLREWGRILCIVLAAISILLSLPGLLFMGLHFGFFWGGYRLIKTVLNALIIWYLVQPQIRSLFQRNAPALPQV